MAVYPTVQVKFFSSHEGLQKLEDDINEWLRAASPDTFITERQMAITNRTPDGAREALERYIVVAVWYTQGVEPLR